MPKHQRNKQSKTKHSVEYKYLLDLGYSPDEASLLYEAWKLSLISSDKPISLQDLVPYGKEDKQKEVLGDKDEQKDS